MTFSGNLPGAGAGAAGGVLGAKLGGGLRASALAHREGYPRASMRRGAVRTLSIVLTVANLAFGVLLVAAAAATTDVPWQGRALMGAIGVFWFATGLISMRGWSLRPTTRRLVSTDVVDGRRATVIAMSRHRVREGLWMLGGLSLFAVSAIVLAAASGETGLALGLLVFPCGPLLLICLPSAADMILALTRPAAVILTPAGVEVRSWFFRGAIDWRHVQRVHLRVATHGTELVVTGSTLAGGPWQRLFSFWPMQARPSRGDLLIDVDAIEPHGRPLEALLDALIRDPSLRAHLGTPWAEQALQPRPRSAA